MFAGCKKDEVSSISLYDPSVPVKDAGGLELPLCTDDTKVTWSVNSNQPDLDESYVMQKLRAMTGVDVHLLVYPISTAGEKIKFLAASKKLHDIIRKKLCKKWGMRIGGMYVSFDRRSSYFNFTESEKEAHDYMQIEGSASPVDPTLPFTPEQKDAINEKKVIYRKLLLNLLQNTSLLTKQERQLGTHGLKKQNP